MFVKSFIPISLQTVYKGSLLFVFSLLFIFVTEKSFANLIFPIDGEVKSYKKGVYTIQTSTALIYIKRSKIGYALDEKLSKGIGNSKVQVNVHPDVISSYRELRTNRNPSSVDNK